MSVTSAGTCICVYLPTCLMKEERKYILDDFTVKKNKFRHLINKTWKCNWQRYFDKWWLLISRNNQMVKTCMNRSSSYPVARKCLASVADETKANSAFIIYGTFIIISIITPTMLEDREGISVMAKWTWFPIHPIILICQCLCCCNIVFCRTLRVKTDNTGLLIMVFFILQPCIIIIRSFFTPEYNNSSGPEQQWWYIWLLSESLCVSLLGEISGVIWAVQDQTVWAQNGPLYSAPYTWWTFMAQLDNSSPRLSRRFKSCFCAYVCVKPLLQEPVNAEETFRWVLRTSIAAGEQLDIGG